MAAAGWYPNSAGGKGLRYWGGDNWDVPAYRG